MNGEEQRDMVGSLAALFGAESMEAWLNRLLDERTCMDCKTAIAGLDGAMAFRGQLPQTDIEGHLCPKCWEWHEALRRGRRPQREET